MRTRATVAFSSVSQSKGNPLHARSSVQEESATGHTGIDSVFMVCSNVSMLRNRRREQEGQLGVARYGDIRPLYLVDRRTSLLE
jgi:hypothetical protein